MPGAATENRAARERIGPRLGVVLIGLFGLLIVTSWPALRGGWVYDDWMLELNPLVAGAHQILPAFGRNSDDFMSYRVGTSGLPTSPTYRPLPMVSFVIVSTLFGIRPLAHHLASLAFHFIVVLLLGVFASERRRISWPAVILLGGFALHPALAEAYQWINGRSDVMAGTALVGAALVLLRSRATSSPLRDAIIVLPIFLAGLLSKETFAIAGAGLIAASLVSDESGSGSHGDRLRALLHRVRRSLPSLLALGTAIAVLFIARGATLSTRGPALGGATDLRLDLFLRRAPRLVALAIETLAVPLPRSMRCLAWELYQPWTAAHIVLVAAFVATLALLVSRKKWRALILVLTAAATLLPVYLVSEAQNIWLGFDRYLYMPGCLLALAALPSLSLESAAARAIAKRPAALAAVAALALLALANHGVANCYRSHDEWMLSMMELRPDEPTGYVLAAGEALVTGRPAVAEVLVSRLPTTDVPPAMVNSLTSTLVKLGRMNEAIAVEERAVARYPDSIELEYQLLFLRGGQRRWTDVLELSYRLARDPVRGETVRDQLRKWLASGQVPPELRARFDVHVAR